MALSASRLYLFTQVCALIALTLVIKLELLAAMLAGLLVFQIVDFGARKLKSRGVKPIVGKSLLLFVVAAVVLTSLGMSGYMFASHVTGPDGAGSLILLLQRMADVVDKIRNYLPESVQHYMPGNIDEWQDAVSDWLRSNARDLSVLGRDVGLFLAHVIIGMIIGGMVAISPAFRRTHGPLAEAVGQRVGFLTTAFRRVVFSQVRISLLNTFLTSVFLLGVLPTLLGGQHLPLAKTMIAVTFFAGLLPVVGNLISNTAIFLISLGVSPLAAVSALLFLIGIHKLEYFVNARIIGSQIHARAWEILLAMLVMESAFGIAGVVAAPVYYAYLKDELSAQKLI
jgi:predicted PurR-regulated permease PerM